MGVLKAADVELVQTVKDSLDLFLVGGILNGTELLLDRVELVVDRVEPSWPMRPFL